MDTPVRCPVCDLPGDPQPVRPGSLMRLETVNIAGLDIPADHKGCVELARLVFSNAPDKTEDENG